MKTVSILGATGSVGRSTADILLSDMESYDVQAVTAHNKADELAGLAVKLKARRAVVADDRSYPALKAALSGTGVEASAGTEAMLEAAAMPADYTMVAIVGMAGLLPAIKAIEQGRCVAIANKEPLVAAGDLVLQTARRSGATLLPVDSEHNAVFQVFEADNKAAIERIILTASGGPFRTWPPDKLHGVTPDQAVAHPNWSMGAKISVDSATMMNKALEIIEAHVLFGLPSGKIDVLIHPQSTIHAMVEYADGSVLAQLGAPDMRTPIAHTLAWPRRTRTPGRRLNMIELSRLDFFPADEARWRALTLAREALKAGSGARIAMNAANECAVAAFLAGRLGFMGIVEAVEAMMGQAGQKTPQSLEEILFMDQTVREQTESYILNTLSRKVC